VNIDKDMHLGRSFDSLKLDGGPRPVVLVPGVLVTGHRETNPREKSNMACLWGQRDEKTCDE
jgi:hypothetical protein